ncbi:MAG: 30S ribosomal protein S16 [Metamycoplasmataceae bacterium]
MVKLRLKRMGNKFNAFYRVVAADARAPRDGRFIEELGYFNPLSEELKLDKELVFKWLNDGAQPTQTVKNLLKQDKIWAEYVLSKDKNSKGKTPKKRTTSDKKIETKAKKPATKKPTAKKPATKKPTVKK